MKLTPNEQKIYDDYLECARNAKEWIRKCVLRLPKIVEKEIWRKKGFKSIYEFSAKTAGLNHDQTRDALRIINHIKDKPELMKVVEKKGINAVRPIATIATKETAALWAEKAMTMSQSVLQTYTRDIRQEKSGINPTLPSDNGFQKPNNLQKITMELPPELASRLAQVKGNEDWVALMKEFVEYKEEAERKFQEDLEKEKPTPVKSDSQYVPAAIARFVKKRSKGLCEHKNCNKKGQNLQGPKGHAAGTRRVAYHSKYFALHRIHDPDYIRHLCEEHHSIAHHGLLKNEELPPENWLTLKARDLFDFKNVINMRVAEFRR